MTSYYPLINFLARHRYLYTGYVVFSHLLFWGLFFFNADFHDGGWVQILVSAGAFYVPMVIFMILRTRTAPQVVMLRDRRTALYILGATPFVGAVLTGWLTFRESGLLANQLTTKKGG